MLPFSGNASPLPRNAGVALILALAAIVTASGLLLWLQARALHRGTSAYAALETEHLRVAAAETARAALYVLAADPDLSVDHPGEDWAQPLERDWPGGIHAWARVEDAAAYVDLNNLACSNQPGRPFSAILRNAFTACGHFEADAPVDALADYVDADTTGDYEAAFYRHADAPLLPPDRELWAPAELLHVHGFSPALFAPPAPAPDARHHRDELFGGDFRQATVLLPDAPDAPVPVNLNTATREALLAVAGIEHAATVRSAMSLRALHPFQSTTLLAAADPDLAASLEGAIDVKSAYYRVRATAEHDGRRRSILAYARRDPDGAVHLLQWLEGVS